MKTGLILFALASCIWQQSIAQQLQQPHITKTRFIGGYHHEMTNNISKTTDNGIIFTGFTRSGTNGQQDGDIPGNWNDPDGMNSPNIVVGKLDSNLALNWVKVFGGTNTEQGNAVKQTADGGYAVLGYTFSNDTDVSGNHAPAGSATSDMWLLKLDAQGNKQWQHCYGGPQNEDGNSFIETPDKGFLLLGTTNGSGGDVPSVYVSSQYFTDWLLLKTDSLGNLQWAKTIGGTGKEGPAVLLAANNGYYIAGSSESYDHECATGVPQPPGTATSDYVLIRLDSACNWQWATRYGGSGIETVGSAIWDNRDSSIVIVGSSNTPWGNPPVNTHSYDELVIKTDKMGLLKWSAEVGDSATESNGMGIAMSPDGGYVTVCKTSWDWPLAPMPSTHIGDEDCWLFKFDDSLHVVYNKILGGVAQETGNFSIVPSPNGFYLGGATSSDQFTEGIMLNSRHSLLYLDIFMSELAFASPSLSVINPVSAAAQWHIYPNPAQHSATILLPENHHKGLCVVYDISGKRIFQQAVGTEDKDLRIDVSGWAKGSYIAEWVPRDGQTLREKLTVY